MRGRILLGGRVLSGGRTQAVTYEASYVPFMFGADEEEVKEEEDDGAGPSRRPALVRGRRTFNDRGQEVLQKEVRARTDSRKADRSVAACHTSDRTRRSPNMTHRSRQRGQRASRMH